MQLLLIPIALMATLLTYAVCYQVLNKFSVCPSPRSLAAAVAFLTGLSLLSAGSGVVAVILIPYAALGLSLLLLPFLKWLCRSERGSKHEGRYPVSPRFSRRRPDGPTRSRAPETPLSAHVRETPSTRE
jgi:hypothetical protein